MEAIVLPLVEKEFTGLIMQFLCIFFFTNVMTCKV